MNILIKGPPQLTDEEAKMFAEKWQTRKKDGKWQHKG